jgi:hypothetical protein
MYRRRSGNLSCIFFNPEILSNLSSIDKKAPLKMQMAQQISSATESHKFSGLLSEKFVNG